MPACLHAHTHLTPDHQVETGQTELEGVLKSTSESLDATLQSSVENVSIVNENVRALDRRLAGVGLAA